MTQKRRNRGDGTLLERKPGVWRLRVSAGKDPLTGRPRQVSRTVRGNRTKALAALRQLAREVDNGQHRSTAATVGLLLDRHIEQLQRRGRGPSTLERYRSIADLHLKPALGRIELRNLTAADIDQYYKNKAETHMPATIRQHAALLSGALTQAVKWDWMSRNPAMAATLPAIPREKKMIPDAEQVRRLLVAAEGNPDLAAAVTLAATTGCRRGELCGLRWSDVDWSSGILVVERQRVRVARVDRTLPLKHGERREVALGALGLAVLRKYREVITERAAELGVSPAWDGWLLSTDCGYTPLSPDRLGAEITALGKRAKVKVTPHAFRRFAATQMLGMTDVRTVAGRLGHNPAVLLNIYAGFVPARDLEAAEGLERLVLGPVKDEEVIG